ncbi:hypothetical protein [Methanocella sp. MCL-LM]|uniref:hypothetical protein n=1 Tax=Methanocella sp. MCL-LM TaxID=3412035 RepID=UPI003C78AF89
MVRWSSLYVYTLYTILLLLAISVIFMLLTSVGEKTMVDETFLLPPGGQKAYDLPPGWVNVQIVETESPVCLSHRNLFGSSQAYGMTGGNSTFGSPLFTGYTVENPGPAAVNVSIRITTGVLNPFGYLGTFSSP